MSQNGIKQNKNSQKLHQSKQNNPNKNSFSITNMGKILFLYFIFVPVVMSTLVLQSRVVVNS